MARARMTATGWAVATIVAGVAITGCNSGKTSAPASKSATTSVVSTPAGPPPDYSALLIQPGDLGGDFTAPEPPVLNFNNTTGVSQMFVNADKSRRIGDTILVVDDPSMAAAGLENTKTNYAKKVSGTWQPVDVGTNGAMISGTSQDNSQAIAVLLFTEGRALVNLEFDSAPGDPIDPGIATDIARKQAAAVKNGLHD
ncbi:hypothetical protein [Mycobacterium montefiorense]|uniref:hypothetical protein n=1 Tax=Mycobacterium montefiorense TaxID=154654 RepID=UPI0021DB89CC|nr:hypothetical protein [Mycobacterium montefiorense]MCV7429377.1 hypothetical protein [Mycobacterium montefiorense]GLE52615.1 hypothetical protein ATCCBAA256_21780 [Mycobacterium montefiorense]